MRPIFIAILLTLILLSSQAFAGKHNEKLSIGDKAPAWKDLVDAVSGKKHSLADLNETEVVVIIFTCNSCPVATEYEDRILKLAKTYAVGASDNKSKVALVAINVNKRDKADLPPAMKQRAEKKKYPFPYLFDETQQIARDFGALFTPEFFVLDRDRRVVYMGAMDDNSDVAKVTRNYVGPAVEAALAGKQPETKETLPVGCRIRYVLRRE
jgi:peroxiredoxin